MVLTFDGLFSSTGRAWLVILSSPSLLLSVFFPCSPTRGRVFSFFFPLPCSLTNLLQKYCLQARYIESQARAREGFTLKSS